MTVDDLAIENVRRLVIEAGHAHAAVEFVGVSDDDRAIVDVIRGRLRFRVLMPSLPLPTVRETLDEPVRLVTRGHRDGGIDFSWQAAVIELRERIRRAA